MPWRKDIPRIYVLLMIKLSRYLASFFLLVLILPGVCAPMSSDVKRMRETSPTPADLLPIDPPMQTWQDFEGDLNQSITIPGNNSLVPYRVDVNVTNLNHTDNRLLNGNFANGVNNWQVPNVPGQNFLVNESGPQGARTLQGNFTGLWNFTQTYPLNATYEMDQFDEPTLWIRESGINVTSKIDGVSGSGTSGNYLNISWWKDLDPIFPNDGKDTGVANRSFYYNGTSTVNKVTIKFKYQTYFETPFVGTYGIIKSNLTVTNPNNEAQLFENIINNASGDPGVGLTWYEARVGEGLNSIFSSQGNYRLSLVVSIEQGIDIASYKNAKSRLLVDNVTVVVNSSIGTFNLGEGTNATQIVPLNQLPLNDTKVTINYCASALPARVNHSNLQLGFAINETWFNLTALSDLKVNEWVGQSIWIGKGNFTGNAASFKLGLMSFNASEILPNETLLVHFTNITLVITSLATPGEITLKFREATKNAPLAILGYDVGIVNASVDYSGIGGFGLGTSLRIHLNSTLAGGVRGRVTIYSWTWREALWRSLNKSLTAIDAYIGSLPSTYANLFSNTEINFTHINFAQALGVADYYLARTYASRVGPNALYTTSIANTSLRALWSALGNASFGLGVPDTVRDYVEEIYDAQQNPRSLVGFLQSDPRWNWVLGNASLTRPAIHNILEDVQSKVPLFVNASTLIDWAGTLQISLNSCIAGETWTIPESSWSTGKTQLFTIGYSKMATLNLHRPLRPAFPILTSATQFVGGAPLLATLAEPTNATASWNYLTREEFGFVSIFDTIIGFLAETVSISQFLASLLSFLSEGTRTSASQYNFEVYPNIEISFSSNHFGDPEVAVTASWQGNSSITSAWVVNSVYALNSTTPILLWEQAVPVEDLVGIYSLSLQWMPPVLPPELNELYIDGWEQNWTAPIALRSALWVGGRAAFTNLGIQQESSEKWFNISKFTILTEEDGNPLLVSQVNQTQQAGDWCLLNSMGIGPRLDFREEGGNHIGYNPWDSFSTNMGSNASYNGTEGFLNLLALSGSWGGDLYIVPSPISNSELSVGNVITRFGGIMPRFAGISNGTIFLTPMMGENTFTLLLPVWEGTRSSAITTLGVNAQLLSQTSPEISITSTFAPNAISLGGVASVTVGLVIPRKPIGHQFDLVLKLSGNVNGGSSIQKDFRITVKFLDVISPQPPLPDSLFLAILTITGSIAVGFLITRWQKFLFFRKVSREEPRVYKE